MLSVNCKMMRFTYLNTLIYLNLFPIYTDFINPSEYSFDAGQSSVSALTQFPFDQGQPSNNE